MRVTGQDHGRLNEVAFAVVVTATDDNFGIGSLFGVIDKLGNGRKSRLVDNSIKEVAEVVGLAHFNRGHIGFELLTNRAPE